MRFATLFKHSESLYQELEKSAKHEKIKGVKVNAFRGSITQIYRDLGLSYTYYGDIRNALERSGCIAVLQRGTSTQESIIVLHHAPDRAAWQEASEDLTAPLEDAMLQQQIGDIKSQLGGINIVEAFTDVERRLEQLDERVRKLEGDSGNGKSKRKSRD